VFVLVDFYRTPQSSVRAEYPHEFLFVRAKVMKNWGEGGDLSGTVMVQIVTR
jgi:hypothetical protein